MYILNESLQSVSIFGVFKMVMVQISKAQISKDVLYCMHFTNVFIPMKNHQPYTQEFITGRVCNSHMVSVPAIWIGWQISSEYTCLR